MHVLLNLNQKFCYHYSTHLCIIQKSKAFIWENSQIQVIKTFKLILTIISALKIINYIEDVSKIICTVDVNEKDWRDNLMQVKWEKKRQHVIYYENKIWLEIKKHYDIKK